ncbi:MAG: ABC transporter ATP-binding protein [Alphaproteobacteria bacterium]|nr:ABC transporter ATP-binding protein [Alphaproteobacteria bacterium]
METVLDVRDLATHIATDAGTLRAVDGASLRIHAGEAVALVGESGCGKSMTALSILRLVRRPGRIVGGQALYRGEDLLALPEERMRDLRGARVSIVFQDPMTFLNPLMRVGDQIVEARRLRERLDHARARALAVEALRTVRIASPERVAASYPHQLSGGMRQRAMIAMAVLSRPDLLIADEPTTALDVTIQAQIMTLLAELRRELGSAMLLITHDLGLVAQFCDRVYVMYAGQIVEEAPVARLFAAPRHPYTRALLRSTLPVDRRIATFSAIEGQPPSLIAPPTGCRFAPRCPEALARCAREAPPVVAGEAGTSARCWLAAEVAHDAA